MPESSYLSGTQPEPFPGTRRHESLFPGTDWVCSGRVSDVGSNTASFWKGHPAPCLLVSSLWVVSGLTLLAMSVVHVGQPENLTLVSWVLKGTDHGARHVWILSTLQTLRPSLGK